MGLSQFATGVAEAVGGRATSDYRSPEEQQALFDAGKTRLRGGESGHNRGNPEQPGAVDIGGLAGGNPRQIEALLRGKGYKVKRVVWETGQGRNQGTGPHYHVEFEDGSTSDSKAAGQAGQHQISLPDVSRIQATPAEQTAMQQPRDSVSDPFDPALTGKMRSAIETEQSRLGFADSLLQQVTAESQEIRSGLEANLQRTVEIKSEINEQTRAHLASLAAVAEPVWQKREQLANQLLELDNMNPLEQGIRSMFDPNYNRRNIQARIRSQTGALNELNAVFDERYKHSQILATLATADYTDSEAIANLMLQNGGEDVRLALQSFNLAGQQVDTLLAGLQADSAVITARQQARADILAGLTIGQVNSSLAQAQQSPTGTVEVNGVPLRAGELQEAQLRFQNQSLAIANTQIAIEKGNLEIAELNKTSVLDTMTIDDVKSAIQNGGNFNGIDFDITKLATRLQDLQQSNQVVAAQQQMESAPGLAANMWNQISGTMRLQSGRFVSLFGQVPGELTRFSQQVQGAATIYRQGLQEARQLGTVDEYVATQLPTLQNLIQQQEKMVKEVVTRWSGGNENLTAIGTAWMTGQPVSSEAAVKGLIHFARNGIPAGTKFTGASAQMLRVVQEEVEAADRPPTEGGSPSLESLMQPSGSASEKEAALMRRVQARLGGEYASSMGLELYNAIPDIARELDLPFKRVSREQWQDAAAYGDQQGLAAVARSLDMRPDDFEAMLRGGADGALWLERQKGLTGAEAQLTTWEDRLTVSQFQATMQHLDANASDTGFVPSQALRAVVSHPGYLRAAQNGEQGAANMSFGGFIANAAGGGNFFQNAEAQANLIVRAFQQYTSATQRARVNRVTALVRDPIGRGEFILGSMPNLAPAQEQVLLREFKRISSSVAPRATSPAGYGTSVGGGRMAFEEVNRSIDAFVLSGTSDDPAVKAALQIIRPHWEKYAGPMTQAVERQAQRTGGAQ
jgi:hypothetical protein